MSHLKQIKLEQLHEDVIRIEKEQAVMLSEIAEAIRSKESIAHVLGMVCDYSIWAYKKGYTQAEIIYTENPVVYEN